MFDKDVYFSEWVEFRNMLPEDIPLSPSDYNHGTAVSSIIVDGPSSNPHMDDGCGRFRVRHFGVAAGNQFSSFTILRNINEIILSNKDIKVWNLSLGSKLVINQNFISPKQQYWIEYNMKMM
nr:S8 family serine peptidase [uncultured Anaerocolumna sp.]